MILTEREQHMFEFMYKNKDDCCIDDGNLLYHYSTRYDDWKKEGNRNFDNCVDSLIQKSLIERDEPPMDCFIMITDQGIEYGKNNECKYTVDGNIIGENIE